MSYLLDTNIITAILKENEKVKTKVEIATLEGKKIFINGISYYEIKRGLLDIKAEKQLSDFELLCKKYGLVWLDSQPIFDKAAEIYVDLKQSGQINQDADILISSLAIIKDLILVSNDKDFERIKGLKSENWLN